MTSPLATEVLPSVRAEFRRNAALVIGISAYAGGVPPLQSAAADAERLANILKLQHGYGVTLLKDAQATGAAIRQALAELQRTIGPEDRVLIYYAGHGHTDDSSQHAGFLIPADGALSDERTWLSAAELMAQTGQLACRHFLLILDCCFAGSLRLAGVRETRTRDLIVMPKQLFRERYERFVQGRAWQVLTSSAGDQTASDVSFDQLARDAAHSPFAQALFAALSGQRSGLLRNDGVITATDLYCFLRDAVELPSLANGRQQTPQLWPLVQHDKGEFVFLAPGRNPFDLPSNPTFALENNPYLGLDRPYAAEQASLFFGRSRVLWQLAALVRAQPLSVLAGPSGSGKTSLAQAGLLPQLAAESPEYAFLPPLRPGAAPLAALAGLGLPAASPPTLANRAGAWLAANPERSLGIVLDQLEQLFAPECPAAERDGALGQLAEALAAHKQRLRVLAIVRSDRLAELSAGALKPHWSRPFDLASYAMADEQGALREAIAGPAGERVIFFESLDPAGEGQAAPFDMVGEIADALSGQPGALPLLSLTMSEIYQRFAKRAPDNRTLALADYTAGPDDAIGGVVGALLAHAERVFAGLPEADQARAQKLLLRMVATGGENPAPLRVHFGYTEHGARELDYPAALNPAMRAVLMRLVEARLVVLGFDAGGPYAELAHSALVRRWPRLRGWLKDKADELALRERLYPAAANWNAQGLQARNRLQRLRLRGLLWQKDNPDMDRARVALRADDSWLNAVEGMFVSYSMVEQTRRERWRWAGLIATTVVFGVLAAVAIGFLIYNLDLQQRAVTRRLLAASNDPPAGAGADAPLLLAAEALVRSGRSNLISDTLQTEAEQNLRNLVAQPALVAPITSTADVETILPAARGDTILLVGAEQARLWSPDGAQRVLPADEVQAGAIAPDGQLVLTLDANGRGQLWDALGQPIAALDYGEPIIAGQFAANGQALYTIADDDSAQRWSAGGELLGASEPIGAPLEELEVSADGRRALLFTHEGAAWLWDSGAAQALHLNAEGNGVGDYNANYATTGAFSPDGQLAAIGWTDGRLEIWDLGGLADGAAPPAPRLLRGHARWINSVAFSPDGQLLLTASADASARLWQLDGTPASVFLSGDEPMIQAAFSPDGQQVLTASLDGTARLWDLSGFQQLAFRHTTPVQSAVFSSDGRRVITQTDDRRMAVWQAQQSIAGIFSVSDTPVGTLELSPDGARLLTTADEDVAQLWSLDGAHLATLAGHAARVNSASFSPDGQRIVTTSDDGMFRLWDASGQPIAELPGDAGLALDAAWSPDSQRLASTDGEIVRLWDPNGQPIGELRGHTGWVVAVAWSPDGQRIATGADDETARVWDLAGNQLAVLRGHEGFVEDVVFSPDGQRIATRSDDRTARVWDLAGKQLAVLRHKSAVTSLGFSPDGRYLVTLAESNVPLLWDLANLAEPRAIELRGHTAEVRQIRFRPDGQRVLTASYDRTALEWDLSGRVVRTLRGHTSPVSNALYARPGDDGQPSAIITAGDDGSLRVYTLLRDELLAQAACRVSGALAPAILAELGASGTDQQPDFDPRSYPCAQPAR